MLSSSAKERLTKLFQSAFLSPKGGWQITDILNRIEEILDKKSFSAAIIEGDQIVRKCDLGHEHRIYRLRFRTVLIPALRILADSEKPMTTQDLIDACQDKNVARMVGKYVSELRHWKLIEFTEAGWKPTALTDAFLQELAKIPTWVWPKEEKLPPECVDGPLKLIHELQDDHPKDDKGQHLEDAAPANSLNLSASTA